MGAPQRKEMFFGHQDIGPELLRHEDGSPLTGNPAPKSEPAKEQTKPLFRKKEEPKQSVREDEPVGKEPEQNEEPTNTPKSEPSNQGEQKKKNLFPLYAGIGGGLAAGGGLAYLAHKKKQERESA
jgi:hypothetical protein